MKNIPKSKQRISAEQIGEMAQRGKDISKFFTNDGKMMPAVQRVNVDFTQPMLNELDATARELNVSRQAVIKTFLRWMLDQHRLAQRMRRSRPSA